MQRRMLSLFLAVLILLLCGCSSSYSQDDLSRAYQDGYKDGESDGIAKGYFDGYEEGKLASSKSTSHETDSAYQSGYAAALNDSQRFLVNSSSSPSANSESSYSDIRSESSFIRTVYITATGSKYHESGCSYLKDSKIAIDLDDAISQGYTPCSRCKP